MNRRIKDLQSSALPLGYGAIMERKTGFEPATLALARRCSTTELFPQVKCGENLHIISKWWLKPDSNWRHADFQSAALPTELPSHKMAELTGVEPAVSCVTGRHVRPLHHSSTFCWLIPAECIITKNNPKVNCQNSRILRFTKRLRWLRGLTWRPGCWSDHLCHSSGRLPRYPCRLRLTLAARG